MAEALVNHDLAGKVEAVSAGTEPTSVNPLAIAAMKEVGIDISRQGPKSIDHFAQEQFDFVITLCDHAAETCPIFFGGTQRLHMGFADPSLAEGTKDEKLAAFRRVRDQIRKEIIEFISAKI